jgi:hypothetical protein
MKHTYGDCREWESSEEAQTVTVQRVLNYSFKPTKNIPSAVRRMRVSESRLLQFGEYLELQVRVGDFYSEKVSAERIL